MGSTRVCVCVYTYTRARARPREGKENAKSTVRQHTRVSVCPRVHEGAERGVRGLRTLGITEDLLGKVVRFSKLSLSLDNILLRLLLSRP